MNPKGRPYRRRSQTGVQPQKGEDVSSVFEIRIEGDSALVQEMTNGGRARYRMSLLDVTVCTTCHLRGHVPGDPDRCRQPIATRLGGEQSDQAGWPA